MNLIKRILLDKEKYLKQGNKQILKLISGKYHMVNSTNDYNFLFTVNRKEIVDADYMILIAKDDGSVDNDLSCNLWGSLIVLNLKIPQKTEKLHEDHNDNKIQYQVDSWWIDDNNLAIRLNNSNTGIVFYVKKSSLLIMGG